MNQQSPSSGAPLVDLLERWRALMPEVAQAVRATGTLRRVAKRMSSEEGYDALVRVQRDLEKLDEVVLPEGDLLARARAVSGEVRAWLDQEWDRRAREVEAELRAHFLAREVVLDDGERGLRAGLLDLRLEPQRDRAEIGFAGEALATVPLNPDRVYRAWQKAQASLERGATPPGELAAQLLEAYDGLHALRGLRAGSRVRLPDVHFQVFVQRQTAQVRQDPRRSRVKEYPRAQFAWDLGALLAEDPSPAVGERRLVFHDASESAARSRSTSVVTLVEGVERCVGDLQA